MTDIWGRLIRAFRDPDRCSRQTVYVYRMDANGLPRKPYLVKSCGEFYSDTELLYYLQNAHGAGEYRVLIRDGSTMLFSGDIGVGAPARAV